MARYEYPNPPSYEMPTELDMIAPSTPPASILIDWARRNEHFLYRILMTDKSLQSTLIKRFARLIKLHGNAYDKYVEQKLMVPVLKPHKNESGLNYVPLHVAEKMDPNRIYSIKKCKYGTSCRDEQCYFAHGISSTLERYRDMAKDATRKDHRHQEGMSKAQEEPSHETPSIRQPSYPTLTPPRGVDALESTPYKSEDHCSSVLGTLTEQNIEERMDQLLDKRWSEFLSQLEPKITLVVEQRLQESLKQSTPPQKLQEINETIIKTIQLLQKCSSLVMTQDAKIMSMETDLKELHNKVQELTQRYNADNPLHHTWSLSDTMDDPKVLSTQHQTEDEAVSTNNSFSSDFDKFFNGLKRVIDEESVSSLVIKKAKTDAKSSCHQHMVATRKLFDSSCIKRENYWDAMYTRNRKLQETSSTLAQDIRSSQRQSILSATLFSINRKIFPGISSIHQGEPVEIQQFRDCTYREAAGHSSIPKMTKMLYRDFIHDSLYNPHYGYFSKHADIFHPIEPIPFNEIRDNYKFMDYLAELYQQEQKKDPPLETPVARQIWHTPTELFQPYYGYAIANYILTQYRLDTRGSDYLHIFEMGSGNGTLLLNILDYIKQHDPQLYQHVKYTAIEISPLLARKLADRIQQPSLMGHVHTDHIEIENTSIFDWKQPVDHPCFFVAMEVIDNFAHDLIRYDVESREPLQGLVLVDQQGDFREVFESVSDPIIARYLDIQSQHQSIPVPIQRSQSVLRRLLPIQSDMTLPEYLPTMSMLLFDQLHSYFPHHRLILSDFHQLPDTVEGIHAPVVQTRYEGDMIPSSTVLVYPGLFDIFFPTDFEMMQKVYTASCPSQGSFSTIQTHASYLTHYSPCLHATRTKWGENPILSLYQNVKLLLS